MEENFFNEDAELLYKRIVEINKELMNDSSSKSLKKFAILNKGTLLDLCNCVYSTIPFSDPPEPYCSDFAEMTAMIIYKLNKGHCFADGNKRTTLLIIMELIKDAYPVFYNDFFKGGLSIFLKDMIKRNLNEDDVINWVRYQYDLKYEISDVEAQIIYLIMQYKRHGFYDLAEERYKECLAVYGPSVALYKSMAKVYTCKGEYDKAINLYEQAIEGSKGKIDEFELLNLKFHRKKLLSRNTISKEEFSLYLKSVSGNRNG
ncbi:Fic family protein [Campylobacter sp. GB48]|uniref:Fic family protein n=1 Tax=Campylobacter TaxID=194 RepID=UPI0021520A4C|nr:Fic family protein [Campylobacter lari]MCR6511678.1 Fic family protein [Campylobacter lari]